jgi:hypothetical protein
MLCEMMKYFNFGVFWVLFRIIAYIIDEIHKNPSQLNAM